jgi:energy-coupling factor transporter ATP-binding protein EcfA2
VIEARQLTKRYGSRVAVDALSFDVRPGGITGFLGPNGSGKSTTMRLILGLDRGSANRPTCERLCGAIPCRSAGLDTSRRLEPARKVDQFRDPSVPLGSPWVESRPERGRETIHRLSCAP